MPKKIVTPLLLLLLLSLSLMFAGRSAAAVGDGSTIPLDQIVLTGRDFADGEGEGVQIDAAGIALAPGATEGVYLSAPLTAPIPFNALVPQWQGVGLADQADFRFYVRSGQTLADATWSEIRVDNDMTLPEDETITGGFYLLPEMAHTHTRVQLRIELARPAISDAPQLEWVRLTFIDSSAAPSVPEAISRQRALDAAQAEPMREPEGYPKPFVVSRAVWCTDPACNYSSDELSYYPVSHLILHHTVTEITSNPIATLQAIWRFHTFTRGWGDIGYNYLVDPDGVLYEGHLGGDNVVGTHSGGANSGSMALSLMGDYTNVTPPAPMRESVIKLFAWKADQMDIDPFDSSYLPYMDWGLPHIMGHRDAYGTTECPGSAAHPLLPGIRDEVARRIGFTPEHLYYDELSPETHFVKSTRPGDDYWWDGPRSCGFNGHAYYTWSVTETVKSTNWAEWRPEVPFSGRYELSVYAPRCYTKAGDTGGARYEVTHAEGTSTVTIDQGAHLGIWMPLGDFPFTAGTAGRLRLTDLTTTDSNEGVWFDAIRLRPLSPGVLSATPGDGAWVAAGPVEFRWTLGYPLNVTQQRLQIATDSTFTNLVVDIQLPASARSQLQTLNGGDYFWRLVLTSNWGETFFAPANHFGVDGAPPSSAVTAILKFPDGHYYVMWRGEDAESGVVGYNIEYRAEGTEVWHLWKQNTRQTGAPFTPPLPGTRYWFRSQARDAVNWLEPLPAGNGDISTAESTLVITQAELPLLFKRP